MPIKLREKASCLTPIADECIFSYGCQVNGNGGNAGGSSKDDGSGTGGNGGTGKDNTSNGTNGEDGKKTYALLTVSIPSADGAVETINTGWIKGAGDTYTKSVKIAEGGSETVTLKPSTGKGIKTAELDGKDLDLSNLTYTDATNSYTYRFATDADHTLAVTCGEWKIVTFRAGERGAEETLGTEKVVAGATIPKNIYTDMENSAITKAPNGMAFFVWRGNDGNVYNDKVAITENVTLTAEFRKNVGVAPDGSGAVIAAKDFLMNIADVE